MEKNNIDNLIILFQNLSRYGMMYMDGYALDNMRNNLEERIENELKGVHKNKICQIADGRYKTHNPQLIKKTRLDLLIALYEYYFHHSPLPTRKRPTIKSIYPQWLAHFQLLVEQGHRSIGTLERYKTDYTRFLAGNELETKDITKIMFQDIKSYYAEITAHEAITRKNLNSAKTLINQIFDYARDQNIPVINTYDIRTIDLCCKEPDNYNKVYSDNERSKVLKVCRSQNNVYSRCIGLMFCLCVRIGEIKALKWSDVDFENRRVFIHRSMVETKEKGVRGEKCVNRTKGKSKNVIGMKIYLNLQSLF